MHQKPFGTSSQAGNVFARDTTRLDHHTKNSPPYSFLFLNSLKRKLDSFRAANLNSQKRKLDSFDAKLNSTKRKLDFSKNQRGVGGG